MSKLFVSYSHQNAEKVTELINIMRDMGYEVWHDQAASGGEKWWNAITENIQKCTIFIFALSPQSLASPACNLEYKYASDLNKPILPIMLEEAKLPIGTLDEIQYVDARNLDKISTITYLSRSLKKLEARIADGEYPQPEIMPEIPRVPINIDPLADVRTILNDIENAKPNELITAIFELKRIVRDNERLLQDAEELLEKITQHPYVPQVVAKEAKETLEIITAVPPAKVVVDTPTITKPNSASFPIKSLLMAFTILLLVGIFIIYIATQNPPSLGGVRINETASPTHTVEFTTTATHTTEPTTIIDIETVTTTFTETATATNTATFTVAPTTTEAPTLTATTTLTFTPEPTATPITIQLNRTNVDEIVELFPSPLIGHVSNSDINTLSFSPDGRVLASAGWDKIVNLWDVESWSIITSFTFRAEVTSLSFSPNGEHLAVGLATEADNVILVHLESGTETIIGSHNLRVNDVVFSPNGELLATASSDGTVKLWAYDSYENLFTFRHSNTWGAWRVSFSPDNRHLVSAGSDGVVRLWNVTTGMAISTSQIIESSLVQGDRDAYIHALAFAADGRNVYIGAGGLQSDGMFRSWDIGNDRIEFGSGFNDHFPSGLALIPSDNLVISASYNRNILFWDEELNLLRRIDIGDEPFNVQAKGREIESVAVHPTLPLIALGSRDGRIRLIGLPPS